MLLDSTDRLTPVEFHGGLFVKRDDLFRPFGPYHVNGGKVRQAIILFETMMNEIKNKYNNGVITAASVYSPQSANIAKVAQHYDIKCISAVGGTKEEYLAKHHMMKLTKYYGSEIRIVAGTGMVGPVHARMKTLAHQLNYLPIEMGELLIVNPKAIFETTSFQVQNLPDELDNLVVSSGVAIQLAGILLGLRTYNKKVKNVISICVGPTREKKLASYFEDVYNEKVNNFNKVTWISSGVPYAKEYNFTLGHDEMDDIYEGKALDWLYKNIDIKNTKTLFWSVGKRPNRDEVDYLIRNNL